MTQSTADTPATAAVAKPTMTTTAAMNPPSFAMVLDPKTSDRQYYRDPLTGLQREIWRPGSLQSFPMSSLTAFLTFMQATETASAAPTTTNAMARHSPSSSAGASTNSRPATDQSTQRRTRRRSSSSSTTAQRTKYSVPTSQRLT